MKYIHIFYKKIRGGLVKNRKIIVLLIHILQVLLANYLAFVLRFDSFWPQQELRQLFTSYLPLLIIIRIIFYLVFELNKNLWRYTSVYDMVRITTSVICGSCVFLVIVRYTLGNLAYPRSIYILDGLLLLSFSGGSRLLVRIIKEYLSTSVSGKKVLLIGAGKVGEMLVRDMKNNPVYCYRPIGFIDEDPYKKGLAIHGITIFGGKECIVEVIDKYAPEEIHICSSSYPQKDLRIIFELCKPYNIPLKLLPDLGEILQGKITASHIRPLSLEHLLQREPVNFDNSLLVGYLKGKTVLVTGAGGSIGSELCRQILRYHPAALIMIEHHEYSLYKILQELQNQTEEVELFPMLVNITDELELNNIFCRHQPHIIYHAAAYKHVPLLENNWQAAIKNNIFGTKTLLQIAKKTPCVEKFISISTDKAVNPKGIMGLSKRIVELLTISTGNGQKTFCAVRFGNVLGSSGSVVPLFKQQIAQGGPITITHPEVKRYFMLIQEAIHLVLISSTIDHNNAIFVLDMGEQINIKEMAENMVRLSSLVPEKDIPFEYTGLRPGEKLSEELYETCEQLTATGRDKINVIESNFSDDNLFDSFFDELQQALLPGKKEKVCEILQKYISSSRR